jgi:DnaJ like chaperone protein
MRWIGKTVGGIVGLVTAGPLGSLLGLVAGHQFDRGLEGGLARARPASGKTQQLFFETTFAVMGHLAKVDGRVSEQEIRVARRIMRNMQLTPEQVQVAIERFNSGKAPDYPLTERLNRLNETMGRRRDLARAFVEIQMQALVGAGALGAAKRDLIWRVARTLDVGRVELAQIEALVRAREYGFSRGQAQRVSLDEAYRVLGVSPGASDNDVKIAYRRLMNQHHPDKLVSRGLPKSMLSMAQEKTQEIRAAYDRIKARREFK